MYQFGEMPEEKKDLAMRATIESQNKKKKH